MSSAEILMPVADGQQWEAVLQRDERKDGEFVYAVSSTGVFCRPSCPSRRPRRENVRFFDNVDDAQRSGFRPCQRCRPLDRANRRSTLVQQLCRYIEEHLEERVSLGQLGAEFGMSPFHLQRTFRAALGVSPREYAQQCRLKSLKSELKNGASVTDAVYAAGYGSGSRVYEGSSAKLGMTPATYRKGAAGVTISYMTMQTPVGRMLVASTDKGICSITFGDSDSELIQGLRREFPEADLKRRVVVLQRWVGALLKHMYGEGQRPDLPLDIRATAFQHRVWKHLQSIPYGSTRSYAEVAEAIGAPTATRAVANACAHNPVAFVVPCHRVVQRGGGTGGYRWGAERKRRLRELERSRAGKRARSAATSR